jgi:hypothetical protein
MDMRFLALLLTGCILSSCATITRGRNEVISVDSNPSGADATISCIGNISATGTTPARLTIPRKAEGCHINIEKSGMKMQEIQLERGFNGSYWLNFVPTVGFPIAIIGSAFGDRGGNYTTWLAVGTFGAAGFIVDRVTGAMYDHNPSVVKVKLEAAQ